MYRKYKPSSIFNGTQLLPAGHVLITLEDGTIDSIVPEAAAGDDIEQLEGILSPGFVNTHCHIELSHFKGMIPEHTGLVNFVQQVMSRRNEKNAEEQDAAMQAAAQELYDSGTAAVGDICNTTASIGLKKNSSLYWYNFIEVTGFVDATAHQRFNDAAIILQQFEQELSTFHYQFSIVPHAPYSVSAALFHLLNEHSAGRHISIHNQETTAEDELYQFKSGGFLDLYQNFGIDTGSFEATGLSSLQSWLPRFTHGQKIMSVHNSFTAEEDVLFAKNKLHYCLCPNANLYIENVLPPVELLMQHNAHIVLGTDSYASNHRLNIMTEINTLRQHFPQIALETVLQWATLNGAKALGIEDRFGSFEKGKKPGLVLIHGADAKRI